MGLQAQLLNPLNRSPIATGNRSPKINKLSINTNENEYYNNLDNTTFNGVSTYSNSNMVSVKSLQSPPTSHTTSHLMPLQSIPESSPIITSKLNGRLGLTTLD